MGDFPLLSHLRGYWVSMFTTTWVVFLSFSQDTSTPGESEQVLSTRTHLTGKGPQRPGPGRCGPLTRQPIENPPQIISFWAPKLHSGRQPACGSKHWQASTLRPPPQQGSVSIAVASPFVRLAACFCRPPARGLLTYSPAYTFNLSSLPTLICQDDHSMLS